MAANEPVLTIVGNLTDDPQLRITSTGVSMCRFSVGCTPRVFDKTTSAYRDGDPLFVTCTAWRDLAEHVAESLAKGVRVIVTGRLRQSRWQTPDGDKRSTYGLEVDEVGPSLRFATAQVTKLTRPNGGGTPAPLGDPWDSWATASPAPAGTGAPGDDTPPF
ncbi:MAG TPA: single-stranded DNA-binding protein [Micromonosporaceae bacterium]|nr:single-stranded DNA-binding protein [Micromonosporaceae bacterium]